MQTKHHFYFTGYSDDVILAGGDKRTLDEYYSTFYLLSNGVVIRAGHTKNGWQIGPTTESELVSIIHAVDLNDDGTQHNDPRIPDWLHAPGYAPVCIIETEEPLEIVAASDGAFSDTSPDFFKAAKLRKAVLEASDVDEEDMPSISAFQTALKKLNF